MLSSLLMATYDYSYNPIEVVVGLLVYGIYMLGIVLSIVAQWKVNAKAGEPGWAAIVPFYNAYVLFKIAFGNGWLVLLIFVPFANIVIAIMVWFKLAKAFGHGVGFGFGLLFLNAIFMLILGFGSSEYVGAN